MDSLLSIVQMPAGVPVATVSIGGARNAGLLAVRILASSDPELSRADRRVPGRVARNRSPQGRGAAAESLIADPTDSPRGGYRGCGRYRRADERAGGVRRARPPALGCDGGAREPARPGGRSRGRAAGRAGRRVAQAVAVRRGAGNGAQLAAGDRRRPGVQEPAPSASDDQSSPTYRAKAACRSDLDLQAALRELAPRQRLAVELHYYLGFPVTEVATLMDCAEGTVKSTLSDARARLRHLLGEEDG